MRAAVQALLRGRAEGRLELIKGDAKQVRVVGAGASCERRGGMHVLGAGESWVPSEMPRESLACKCRRRGRADEARGQAPIRGYDSLSDAKLRLQLPQGCVCRYRARGSASGVGQARAVSERPCVQVALDGEPGAVTFRCLLLLNPHTTIQM